MTLLVVAILATVAAVCVGEVLGPDMAGWADGAWVAWKAQHAQHQNDAHVLAGRDA